ncbi:MAG: type II toxin-antitoxin system RelE/ParE family toxin [bacterium]|nr:type II toxin-antitoxin system RelE/ParE family toxin [bacterium]
MKLRFLSCAEQEFAEAVDHYNGQSPGLGYKFAAEVKSTLDRIVLFPDAWPLCSRRARRCIMNRFPYAVLYQMREEGILVLAVLHIKRKPTHWQSRL